MMESVLDKAIDKHLVHRMQQLDAKMKSVDLSKLQSLEARLDMLHSRLSSLEALGDGKYIEPRGERGGVFTV